MESRVLELNCPGCGARVDATQKECEWCHKPIIVTSFNNVFSMSQGEVGKYAESYREALNRYPNNGELHKSSGVCYLKLRMTSKALEAFEKAIQESFNDSESYFYAAVSALGGKKAFLNQRPAIDRALEYIDAALAIEPRGIYHYFKAYVKYDYFKRKFFQTSPNYEECLQAAKAAGVSDYDVNQLFTMLNVQRPEVM